MSTPEIADLVIGSVVIAAVSLLALEGLGRFVGGIARRAGARRPTIRAILETCRVIGIAIAAVGIVTYTGLASIFAVLTISGIVGLAVSLALQATLSNIVAGVLLLHDRGVRFGDSITYGAITGRVIRIALRNTWVLTETGEVAIIGNSSLNNGPLVNHTASQHFRSLYEDRSTPE